MEGQGVVSYRPTPLEATQHLLRELRSFKFIDRLSHHLHHDLQRHLRDRWRQRRRYPRPLNAQSVAREQRRRANHSLE